MAWFGIGKQQAQKELEKILKGREIPHFPGVVHRILELLREPEVDFEAVVAQLQWDPGLTVQLLKTVNSAAYGLAHPIADVKHAVSFLGRAGVEQIVLGVAVRNLLPARNAPGFDAQRYWRTASYRAALSRAIARQLHPSKEAESFTAALLQDLAIPLLVHALPVKYGRVLSQWHSSPGAELHDLERASLGFSHDEVGGLFAEHWELPEGLAKGIAGHHDHEKSDLELLPALRLVAQIREAETDACQSRLLCAGQSDYGIDPTTLSSIIQEAKVQAADLTRGWRS